MISRLIGIVRGWLVEHVAEALAAGAVAALGAGWLIIWQHVNPQFTYAAWPAEIANDGSNRGSSAISAGRHWFGLGQIIKQIDEDTRVYCSGGWDQRLSRVGLRACYSFQFVPVDLTKLHVCASDHRSAAFSTTDQLLALRFFEKRFAPLECIKITHTGSEAYEITPGRDAYPRVIQHGNSAPQIDYFCACSDAEIRQIASTSGARLP